MIDENQENIYRGELIKEAMENQKLTFEKVAEKSGVTRPTIYRIIDSDPKVAIGLINSVADAVNVPCANLFKKQRAEKLAA